MEFTEGFGPGMLFICLHAFVDHESTRVTASCSLYGFRKSLAQILGKWYEVPSHKSVALHPETRIDLLYPVPTK